jgi:hypothetical protein
MPRLGCQESAEHPVNQSDPSDVVECHFPSDCMWTASSGGDTSTNSCCNLCRTLHVLRLSIGATNLAQRAAVRIQSIHHYYYDCWRLSRAWLLIFHWPLGLFSYRAPFIPSSVPRCISYSVIYSRLPVIRRLSLVLPPGGRSAPSHPVIRPIISFYITSLRGASTDEVFVNYITGDLCPPKRRSLLSSWIQYPTSH